MLNDEAAASIEETMKFHLNKAYANGVIHANIAVSSAVLGINGDIALSAEQKLAKIAQYCQSVLDDYGLTADTDNKS